MNKRLLFSAAFFCMIGLQHIYSNPIDANKAKEIAHAFLNRPGNTQAKIKSISNENLQLVYTCSNKEKAVTPNTSENYFYVFNRSNENGFVIVSADDCCKTILGYTDSGNFDVNTIPDGLKYWLESSKEGLKKQIVSQRVAYTPVSTTETQNSIAPLLGNIAYNQDAPYNNLCPKINALKGRSVTGCAATSMAQVMRYHRYPAHGIGNKAYTTKTLHLSVSADFANTTYDWDHMRETYEKGKYSDEEATAIATLMYHCGVAMNMDYNDSSGAIDFDMISAFVNNFNYDGSTIRLRYRDFYTSDEWTNIIRQELNENRPVIYNGQSLGGGHSFVCDGYDANGLFHINWGWGGQSNGYFALNVLDPGSQGIGGGSGGFCCGQTILTGIQPLKGEQNTTLYDLKALGIAINQESISGTSQAAVSLLMLNFSVNDFSGNIGVCLIAEDNENDKQYIDLKSTTVMPGIVATGGGRIKSSDFPDGRYKMYPAYKQENSDDWELMPVPTFMPEYILAITQNGTTTFSDDVPQSDPQVTDFKVVGELVTGQKGTFEFTIQNEGKELNQAVCVALISGREYYIVGLEGLYLAGGETKTITLTNTIELKEGKYNACVAVYSGILGLLPLNDFMDVTVLSKSSNISDTSVGSISIYPNPVTTTLQIDANEPVTNIHIFNLSGQEVMAKPTIQSEKNSINVAALPSGSYILRLETSNNVITHKFIKK